MIFAHATILSLSERLATRGGGGTACSIPRQVAESGEYVASVSLPIFRDVASLVVGHVARRLPR